MPLLLLLIVAVTSGLAAAFLAHHYRRRTLAPLSVEAAELTLALGVAAVLVGGAVLALLAAVVRNTDALAGLDTGAAEWGDRHATAFSQDSIELITELGGTWVVVVAAVAVGAVEIARTRSRWVVPFLLAVMLGGTLLTEAIKQLVDRARPELEPVAATLGPSFPSGHSSTAAASWAAFALVAGRWWGPRAWPALASGAVGIAVAVAVSRVLLDVHWLTDVLAGLALGWAWFAACAIAFGGHVLRFGAAAEAVGEDGAEAASGTHPEAD